jgi:cysteinyl-tRNA synthetase
MIAERAISRQNKNWDETDRLRELNKLGVGLEDTAQGSKVKKV